MFSDENTVVFTAGQVTMDNQQPKDSDGSSFDDFLRELDALEKPVNRMILIGAPRWVKKIIQLLQVARIAEVGDWSRLIQTRNPDEVISLMHRPRVDEEA